MTTNNSASPTTVRWDDPDGSWWIIAWDPDRGRYDATKFTYGDDGKERIVDDAGFGDRRITTVDELAAQMHRDLPPEVVDNLETAALANKPEERTLPDHLVDNVEEAAAAPADLSLDRPIGARYRIDFDDSTWWELGWDQPLGTFFATRLTDAGDDVGHRVVEDHGNGLSAIGTIAQLARTIGRPIPPGVAHELAADAAAHPFTSAPRFMPEADMLLITPDPADGSARRAELARWEARLRAQELQLEAWAASLSAQNAVEPLWTLPSDPVVAALRNLQTDMAGDNDLPSFATGLGFDSAFVEDLRANRLPAHLDIDQISQVCEGLRCSPYDLWGPDLAQRILHAYGPERWPSHIEPLADGRDLPNPADEFLTRRLEAHAEAQVARASLEPPVETESPDPDEKPPRVSAVCYRREGLLAQEPSGVIREVDPGSDTPPDVEAYHFKFRQVTEPRDVLLYPPTGIGEPAPASHDADPTLANTAESFRNLPWLPEVDLVRFVDGTGRQEWLGRNPDAGTWETWDDPRTDYPGDPTDVLDPAGFTDPADVAVEEMTTTRTEAIEMDQRFDARTDNWVDDGTDYPGLPPDSDDTVPVADLDF
jgi:hypothetical protein